MISQKLLSEKILDRYQVTPHNTLINLIEFYIPSPYNAKVVSGHTDRYPLKCFISSYRNNNIDACTLECYWRLVPSVCHHKKHFLYEKMFRCGAIKMRYAH